MAAKVFRTGLLETSGSGDIGYAISPLDEVHAAPAQRAIEGAGGEIRMRTRVRSIARDSSSFEVVSDVGPIEADAVIVCVDHLSLGGIAGTRWPDVEGLGSSPIVNLHFVLDRVVLEDAFVAVVDSPLQWVFDRTAASGLAEGQYVAISLSGADAYSETPSARLLTVFEPELRRVFPAAAHASVVDFFVTREKQATFRAVPGTAALRPSCSTHTPGLYLAGAYTDTGWPATMEGAVRSGRSAARAALIGLGRTRSLPPETVDAA
jgi:hypothetical protein